MENQFESEDEMSYESENRHPNRQDGFPVSSVFKFRRIGFSPNESNNSFREEVLSDKHDTNFSMMASLCE
jgi:hypothetical protein